MNEIITQIDLDTPLEDAFNSFFEANRRAKLDSTRKAYQSIRRSFERYLKRSATVGDLTVENHNGFLQHQRDVLLLARKTNLIRRNTILLLWQWLAELGVLPAPEIAECPLEPSGEDADLARDWNRIEAAGRRYRRKVGGVAGDIWWPAILGLAAETGKKYAILYSLEGTEFDLEKQEILIPGDTTPIRLSKRTVEDVGKLLASRPNRPFRNLAPIDFAIRLNQLARAAGVGEASRIEQCLRYSHWMHTHYLAQQQPDVPEAEIGAPKYQFDLDSRMAHVTINGIQHPLGFAGSTASWDEYARIIAEWNASGKSPTFGHEVKDLTVAELVADYEVFATEYYGLKATSEVYRIQLATKYLVRFYGRTLAAEFDHLKFKAIRQAFIDNGNARRSINAHMKRIVRLFKWGVSEGKIPPEVPQVLALIPGLQRGHTKARETPPVQPADDEVVEETLTHLSPVVADMVRLQRLTGMRPGELCILRPCDINRANDVWVYYPKRHKTMNAGRERPIFIGPRGQKLLAKYLDRDPEAYCFQPREAVDAQRRQRSADRKTPISCGNRPGVNVKRLPKKQAGDRYEPKSYNRSVAYVLKRIFPEPAGLSEKDLAAWKLKYRWSPNRLRHAAATEIRKRYGLEAAQVILGHAKCDTTQIYAQRDFELGLEVASKLG